jgi:hypothetical protein
MLDAFAGSNLGLDFITISMEKSHSPLIKRVTPDVTYHSRKLPASSYLVMAEPLG